MPQIFSEIPSGKAGKPHNPTSCIHVRNVYDGFGGGVALSTNSTFWWCALVCSEIGRYGISDSTFKGNAWTSSRFTVRQPKRGRHFHRYHGGYGRGCRVHRIGAACAGKSCRRIGGDSIFAFVATCEHRGGSCSNSRCSDDPVDRQEVEVTQARFWFGYHFRDSHPDCSTFDVTTGR